MKLNSYAHELLAKPLDAFVTTINPDGSAQTSAVWVSAVGDDVVFGSGMARQKMYNLKRDPRAVLAIDAREKNHVGLGMYMLIHGTATIHPGESPDLMDANAQLYLGRDAFFVDLRQPDAPAHALVRVKVDRVEGVGPWVESERDDLGLPMATPWQKALADTAKQED
ncbi:TIGR03618 family F420-dependent PPOX class oxidoreductase [Candidatus Poriferisocius sp.]|uniref:TIGR03618 family F420-dependent PPOX class oxidoreductase n=1 Tax=Candidatus Poriferisocius sp. TaxID=3101276 RepID=UPI003B5B370D